jgi:hypothetical protein
MARPATMQGRPGELRGVRMRIIVKGVLASMDDEIITIEVLRTPELAKMFGTCFVLVTIEEFPEKSYEVS